MRNETEEMLYEAFKHQFEQFLQHSIEYEEVRAGLAFHDDLLEKFVERFYREDFNDSILHRIGEWLDKHGI